MPAKLRTAKPLRCSISEEAISLFAQLERTPARKRHGTAWRAGSRRLAEALGSTGVRSTYDPSYVEDFASAWLCGCLDVLDPGIERREPASPHWRDVWTKVVEMRQALLAAVAERASVH
jgi:hypothetical protein